MNQEEKFNAFEDCLQKMQAGAEVDRLLESYPQWADEFRPMLQAAQAVRRWDSELQVPAEARLRSREQFLEAARARSGSSFNTFSFFRLRLAPLALAMVIGLILFTVTGVVASAQALPGDALYPVKRFTERTQLLLVDNPARRVELEKSFDQERVEEVNALIGRSHNGQVSFVGLLTSMEAGQWVVGGIPVLLTADTQVKGEIETGIYVEVRGVLREDGTVLAERLWDREFEITGQVVGLDSHRLIIDGVEISLISLTDVQGTLVSGSRVKVQAVLTRDGQLQAHVIEVLELPADYREADSIEPLLITTIPEDDLSPKPEETVEVGVDHQEKDETVEPQEEFDDDESEEDISQTETPDIDEPDEDDDESQGSRATSTPEPGEDGDEGDSEESPDPTKSDDDDHEEEPEETQAPTEEAEEDESPDSTPDETEDETEEPHDDDLEETPKPDDD